MTVAGLEYLLMCPSVDIGHGSARSRYVISSETSIISSACPSTPHSHKLNHIPIEHLLYFVWVHVRPFHFLQRSNIYSLAETVLILAKQFVLNSLNI